MNQNLKAIEAFQYVIKKKCPAMLDNIWGMLFLLLFSSNIFSQQPNEMFCNKTSKIYLVGSEPYQNNTTFSINWEILKQLNSSGIYPKYFLLEVGHGMAFLLNRYLESGEKDLLMGLFPFDTITSNYYTKLRGLHQTLSDNHKFSFVGVNYDHDDEATHLALRYLLLNEKEFADNTMCTLILDNVGKDKRVDYLICSFVDQRLNAERIKEDINLMVDLINSPDSAKIIKKMGVRFLEAKLVLKGYLLGKERKNKGIAYYIPGDSEFQPKRENLILENIYQLFSNDTAANIFGTFTSYSKLFIGDASGNDTTAFNTFANALNYDSKYPLTNSKICASVIIYKSDLKRQSKNYELSRDELEIKYKSLEPKKLFIEQYTGKYPMINQLLFYNHKPIRK